MSAPSAFPIDATRTPFDFGVPSGRSPVVFNVGTAKDKLDPTMATVPIHRQARWGPGTPYERFQSARELLFAYNGRDRAAGVPALLTLGQVNLSLQNAYQQYQNRLKPIGNRNLNDKEQLARDFAAQFRDQGQDMFMDSSLRNDDVYQKPNWEGNEVTRFVSSLSVDTVYRQFRLLGVKMTHENNATPYLPQKLDGTIGIHGKHIVANYWQHAATNRHLYLIIKQQKVGTMMPVQFVPWCGQNAPSNEDLYFDDEVGNRVKGYALFVGRVQFTPLYEPMESVRLEAQGIAPVGKQISIESISLAAKNAPYLEFYPFIAATHHVQQ